MVETSLDRDAVNVPQTSTLRAMQSNFSHGLAIGREWGLISSVDMKGK